MADFTYVWTTKGWLFVATVLDLYSCKVAGWSMSSTITAQLVTDALLLAIWRRGDCCDYVVMESFFSTLKRERVYRQDQYVSRDQARADVIDYIESFYNPLRRHSTLGLVSPDQFEKLNQA